MYRGGRATSRFVRLFAISLPSPSMYEFLDVTNMSLMLGENNITVFQKKIKLAGAYQLAP